VFFCKKFCISRFCNMQADKIGQHCWPRCYGFHRKSLCSFCIFTSLLYSVILIWLCFTFTAHQHRKLSLRCLSVCLSVCHMLVLCQNDPKYNHGVLTKDTLKLLINAPCVYFNTDLRTLAFNRDPVLIGDPASIRTLAVSPLHLLMSVVPIFPVYVNFTLHVLILSVYIFLVSLKKQGMSVSALNFGSSYDITSVWLVL